jgi:nickel-dependent lactate racemase
MRIPVWYCDGHTDLELPDSCRVDLYDLPHKRLTALDDSHWLNSGKIPDDLIRFVQASGELLVLVNDHYRPTPTARVLETLAELLLPRSVHYLVATALHAAPSVPALAAIFGELYPSISDRVQVHSAYDEAQLAIFGSSDRQVRLNRLFEECDSVLIIGSVEPHYFAGFTGGRKIILPGCSSFADTSRNHANALSPHSQPLATRGNPVWEDIQARTAALDYKHRYAIQLVCDHQRTIFHASSGDWDAAYNDACTFVRTHFAHAVPEPYDAVICVVYPPLDKNLYQLQKSYENTAAAVRDGGTILLISACREGVGDYRFVNLAKRIANGEGLDDGEAEDLLMGIHKVKRTERLAKRVNLTLVSTLLSEQLEYLHIQPRSVISDAVDELLVKYGRDCRIAVVPDSASQVLHQ